MASTSCREENGIDIRNAIDVIRLALRQEYDVALIFSQDQNLSEGTDKIREIAQEQGSWITVAGALPENVYNRRGMNRTDCLPISRETYGVCLGHRDERRKSRQVQPVS